MNKEELIKEYDEKAKVLRDEFISKLEDDKKEFQLTYPEDEEILHFISNSSANICDTYYFDNDNFSKTAFEHGLYFKTREEAEQFLKERKLLFKLHQWAKIHNEGWKADFKDGTQKKVYITYFINMIGISGFVVEVLWSTHRFSKLPYFKSEEIAQECIELFGEEIKEVLLNV